MYGLIFNARGVGDAPKKRFIKDKINEFGLDFVCIQETKKSEFEDDWLNNVGGRFCFIWLWEPSRGASGGLLTGVREDRFEVNTCSTGRFFTKMVLMDKETRFKWVLVNVYGAANSKINPIFLLSLCIFSEVALFLLCLLATLTLLEELLTVISLKRFLSSLIFLTQLLSTGG
jgi:hypothetical protein